jgi:hypothetical protein
MRRFRPGFSRLGTAFPFVTRNRSPLGLALPGPLEQATTPSFRPPWTRSSLRPSALHSWTLPHLYSGIRHPCTPPVRKSDELTHMESHSCIKTRGVGSDAESEAKVNTRRGCHVLSTRLYRESGERAKRVVPIASQACLRSERFIVLTGPTPFGTFRAPRPSSKESREHPYTLAPLHFCTLLTKKGNLPETTYIVVRESQRTSCGLLGCILR